MSILLRERNAEPVPSEAWGFGVYRGALMILLGRSKMQLTSLKPKEVIVTQAMVNQYADLSGDHNPLHLDEEFAKTTPYGTRIAHGMLLVATTAEMLTSNFGVTDWSVSGRLTATFIAPTPVGSTLLVQGEITNQAADGTTEFEVTGIINNDKQVLKASGSVVSNC